MITNRMNFGELLHRHLKLRGVQAIDFARRVGVSRSMVSLLQKGLCPMPMERVVDWVKELGLTEAEAKEFREAAGLTHAPEVVKELIDELRWTQTQLRARIDKQRKEYEDLLAEVRRGAGGSHSGGGK